MVLTRKQELELEIAWYQKAIDEVEHHPSDTPIVNPEYVLKELRKELAELQAELKTLTEQEQ